MRFKTFGIQIISSIAFVCVLAAADVRAGDEAETPPAEALDLSGRWEGRTFELARRGADCDGRPCTLTLDVVRCRDGWCGIEVTGAARRCGATALTLDGGASGGTNPFKGRLELAKGTEPYVVEVYLVPAGGGDAGPELQIVGDTGGEFRMFRRSFPFNATLARAGDALCRPESTVSLLD